MLDNYSLLKPFLVFDNPEDDFYMLQIIQRRKEHPDLKINNRCVDTIYLYEGDLERKYDRIKQKCQYFKARAYLRLNRRSAHKTALNTLVKISQMLQQGNYKAIKDAYSSSAGEHHQDKNKKWLIDLDGDYVQYVPQLVDLVITPLGGKVYERVPTLNGVHLITSVFDRQRYNILFNEVCGVDVPDVHKDNPTILYYGV